MKYFIRLFLGVFLCVSASYATRGRQRGGQLKCYVGQNILMVGGFSQNSAALANCSNDLGTTMSCSKISMSLTMNVAGSSISAQMFIGQCIPAAVCETLTCNDLQSSIPPSLSANLGGCTKTCCQENGCNVLQDSSVSTTTTTTTTTTTPPLVGECQPPLWNYQISENWLLPGVIRKSRPKFTLKIKGIRRNGLYRPGRKYEVTIRVRNKKKRNAVKINGFYMTLSGNTSCTCPGSGRSCGLGKFEASGRSDFKLPTVQTGCDEPLVMDDTSTDYAVTPTAHWIAPSCGVVEMRVTVKGNDGKYYEDVADEPEYRVLTKILRPKPKKNRRRKNKRM